MTDLSQGLARKPQRSASSWVHPHATVIGHVILEDDASVWPQAVLRGDTDLIKVGKGSNVQDGAVLHCDPGMPCIIGDRVTIGHRAVVHGCTIGDGALIGIGAIVLNGAKVGEGSLVAAGAVVSEGMEIPPHSLVLGIPAKVRGPLTDAQRERVAHGHEAYLLLKEAHRKLP